MGSTFVIDTFDGRESPELIDGMAVDDVWGWLLPTPETKPTDEHFGLFVRSVDNGTLRLTWEPHQDD